MPLPISIAELFTDRADEWERVEFKATWHLKSADRLTRISPDKGGHWQVND